MTKGLSQWKIQEWIYWYISIASKTFGSLNLKVLMSRVQHPMPRVYSLTSSAQSPEFSIHSLASHSNQPSSVSLKLIDWFLIKIQPCEDRISVIRFESRMPATSKMEIFVTIFKDWKLPKIVTDSFISDVTVVLYLVSVVW